VKRFGLTPLARFVSYAAKGVPPHIMGIGPIEAIPAALRYAGLKQEDIDWFELNEAFAAQSLAVMNTLGLDPAKVNPMGGAIALGHPLGATGAIRSATVVHALKPHKLKYGMVTMCVGMGQGAAGIFESTCWARRARNRSSTAFSTRAPSCGTRPGICWPPRTRSSISRSEHAPSRIDRRGRRRNRRRHRPALCP
jgi:hypothetical protein